MSPETSETPGVAPISYESPGAAVRAARERAGLTIDELAAHTKLPRVTIDALERDDFGSLLEPVYVRGYYRKCAKVLGLSEPQLLASYGKRVTPKSPILPAKLRLGTGADLDGSRRWGSMLVLAVIAIAAVFAIWFLRGERGPLLPPKQSAVTTTLPAESVSAAGSPAALASNPAAAGPSTDPAPASAPLPGSGSATTVAPAVHPALSNTLSSASGSTEPAPASRPGTTQLYLNFVATSWAKVQDASGRLLLNRLVQAGERPVFDGVPPYSVFLGNTPGVEVQYAGARLDIKATGLIHEDGRARFTVPLAQRPAP